MPSAVVGELSQPATPPAVRAWMGHLPEWATVRTARTSIPGLPAKLGRGEREAIALAEELSADVLLADDEAARSAAERRGIPVQGTLGVLDTAAQHGLVADLLGALQRLKATNFRASQKLFDYILERHRLS